MQVFSILQKVDFVCKNHKVRAQIVLLMNKQVFQHFQDDGFH